MLQKTFFILLAAFFLSAATLSAQSTTPKYGHLNLGNLLEEMPDTKLANDSLKVFADKLSTKDDSLTKSFQEAYVQLEKEYNAGTLTAVQVQTRQAELQKQQEFIQKFEQDAQKELSAKREKLLSPILTRVEGAVKAVATENGYLMIFDTSSGAMLFASDTDDVTKLVKAKLGI